MTIREGQAAPKFRLPAHPEGRISLEAYAGKQHVVVFFYSRGNTPGCTNEAMGFQSLLGEFEAAGAAVLGISPDDLAAHARFAEKRGLSFPLLSDADAKVATKYGVWKERTMYGRTYMGIERTTFVIGLDGKVCRTFPKVKVAGHAQAVLEFVQSLRP